jgi:hypothetical protein
VYNNEQRINHTSLVPTASTICRVKTKHSRLKPVETCEEYITYYQSLLVANLITDKGDPDGRNVQTGLTDWIG